MSEKKNGVDTTLNDLGTVDVTNPILKPVPAATITLDEEPAVPPSATQLLDPVEEVPTDPRVPVVSAARGKEIGESAAATQPRRQAPLKADAFESFPSLEAAKKEEVVPRGAPPAWQKAQVWTPGLIALTAAFVLMVLVVIFVLVHG